jgi:hypothetical protein
MRQKKVKLFSVMLLLGLGLTTLQAQNTLYVKDKAGATTSILLSELRNVTFPSGNVILTKTDGATTTLGLADVRYLSFIDYSTNVKVIADTQNGKFKFFPNPVIDEMQINYESTNTGLLRLEIFDLQGKVVYQEMINSQNGTNNLKFNLSQLCKGLYLCRLIGNDKFETVKFIKN